MTMLYLAIFFFFAGIILLQIANRHRSTIGLPEGKIIYADTSKWAPVEKPLYDPSTGLSGKPDYLIKKSGMIIPVEVKSGRHVNTPYDSHIYQLAAYCHLVNQEYNVRPDYGIIHYPNRTFRIEYTTILEDNLLNILTEMRSQSSQKQIHRSHTIMQRCVGCGYQSICDQKLS